MIILQALFGRAERMVAKSRKLRNWGEMEARGSIKSSRTPKLKLISDTLKAL